MEKVRRDTALNALTEDENEKALGLGFGSSAGSGLGVGSTSDPLVREAHGEEDEENFLRCDADVARQDTARHARQEEPNPA